MMQSIQQLWTGSSTENQAKDQEDELFKTALSNIPHSTDTNQKSSVSGDSAYTQLGPRGSTLEKPMFKNQYDLGRFSTCKLITSIVSVVKRKKWSH